MIFRKTPQFNEDYHSLSDADQRATKRAFPNVIEALQGNAEYYSHYRIKKMRGIREIWEGHVKHNLCFTFHYERSDGERVCFFRRIGTHDIYDRP